MSELDEFEAEFKAALEESHDAFNGTHKDALNELAGLSKQEIDAILPKSPRDLLEYERLMTVVKKASAKNLSNAQLVERIEGLGKVAVSVAKKVPSLDRLL